MEDDNDVMPWIQCYDIIMGFQQGDIIKAIKDYFFYYQDKLIELQKKQMFAQCNSIQLNSPGGEKM